MLATWLCRVVWHEHWSTTSLAFLHTCPPTIHTATSTAFIHPSSSIKACLISHIHAAIPPSPSPPSMNAPYVRSHSLYPTIQRIYIELECCQLTWQFPTLTDHTFNVTNSLIFAERRSLFSCLATCSDLVSIHITASDSWLKSSLMNSDSQSSLCNEQHQHYRAPSGWNDSSFPNVIIVSLSFCPRLYKVIMYVSLLKLLTEVTDDSCWKSVLLMSESTRSQKIPIVSSAGKGIRNVPLMAIWRMGTFSKHQSCKEMDRRLPPWLTHLEQVLYRGRAGLWCSAR